MSTNRQNLLAALADKSAVIGIIGIGYVGLPLCLRFAEAGYKTIGFDIDPAKVDKLNAGQTFINKIINYLVVNGTIDKAMLTKAPFNEKHYQGIFGLFPDPIRINCFVSIIDKVNGNVVA